MMRCDIRKHAALRDQVHAGLSALRVQGRQIWGDTRHTVPQIVIRLMVGVGDIARLARDRSVTLADSEPWKAELQKELGNVLFSTIRWIDDLGFDPMECLWLAINAQEQYARSEKPR